MVKTGVGRYDACLADPTYCLDGFSLSVFEKLDFRADVFDQEHDQSDRYIVSTGGGLSKDDEVLYPGVALFRRGLEVHAVVATQTDLWTLGAVGQAGNASWHSLGLTWHRHDGLRVSGLP